MKSAMKFGFLALVASAGLLAQAGVAHADPHGWHNGGPKYWHEDNRYHGRPVVVNRYVAPPRYVFRDNDRIVINDYIARDWRPLPRAYAPRYLIGAPLAYGVDYYPVPQDVLVQLQPVPYGYQYVRVDDDVLLLDATANVIDAVAHLNHR